MKHLSSEAENRLGFRIHAVVYVTTLPLLFVINFWTGPPYWVAWVLLGWTLGSWVTGTSSGDAASTKRESVELHGAAGTRKAT